MGCLLLVKWCIWISSYTTLMGIEPRISRVTDASESQNILKEIKMKFTIEIDDQTRYSLISNDKMTEKQNARQNLKHTRLTCTNTNTLARQTIHHRPPSPPLPLPHPVGTHKWSNPWGLPEGLQTCIVMRWIKLSTGSSHLFPPIKQISNLI